MANYATASDKVGYVNSGRSTGSVVDLGWDSERCRKCRKRGVYVDSEGRKRCKQCNWIGRKPGSGTNVYPSYISRLPEIIRTLEQLPQDNLDRAACSALLNIRRSAAVEMMKRIGARQLGNSLFIERKTLIARLREFYEHPDAQWKIEHGKRVAAAIAEAKEIVRAKSVTAPRPQPRQFDELPGVSIEGKELRIEFEGTEDLVAKLFGFAQAIAREPERFVERTA